MWEYQPLICLMNIIIRSSVSFIILWLEVRSCNLYFWHCIASITCCLLQEGIDALVSYRRKEKGITEEAAVHGRCSICGSTNWCYKVVTWAFSLATILSVLLCVCTRWNAVFGILYLWHCFHLSHFAFCKRPYMDWCPVVT